MHANRSGCTRPLGGRIFLSATSWTSAPLVNLRPLFLDVCPAKARDSQRSEPSACQTARPNVLRPPSAAAFPSMKFSSLPGPWFQRLCLVFLAGAALHGADSPALQRDWQTRTNATLVAGAFNDADSFKVRLGEEIFVFRLAYVDAIEANDRFLERNREQAEHFGVPPERIPEAGRAASADARRLLTQPFTVQTRWANALGSGRKPRFYAIVTTADGRDLGEELIRLGWARPKGLGMNRPDGTRNGIYRRHLVGLETAAKRAGTGLWGPTWRKKAAYPAPARKPVRTAVRF